jgi:hypothetical protein
MTRLDWATVPSPRSKNMPHRTLHHAGRTRNSRGSVLLFALAEPSKIGSGWSVGLNL